MTEPRAAAPRTCAECGASLRADAEWCPQCYAPAGRPEPEKTFAHADAFIGPRPRIRYSRRAKTDVSFGLVGRIVATLLLAVAPAGFLLWNLFPFGIVFMVSTWPVLLPAIWKKAPVLIDEGSD